MAELALSVIVVTFNRVSALQRTLAALERQTLPREQFEVLVVNDGSTDRTEGFLRDYAEHAPSNFTLRMFHQSTAGPAKARNHALRQANGSVVLFLGDDVIPTPELLEEHMEWHRKQPDGQIAVLGLTTWDPMRRITPFMRWMERSGPQYRFWAIDDPDNAGYECFYGSNVSVKREFILTNGMFDEEFPPSTYEDMEAAYRMEQAGMRLVYNARAVGHHDHYTTLESAIRRMRRLGRAHRMYLRKTGQRIPRPAFTWGPQSVAADVKYRAFHAVGRLAQRYKALPGVYSYLLEKALMDGMKDRKALR